MATAEDLDGDFLSELCGYGNQPEASGCGSCHKSDEFGLLLLLLESLGSLVHPRLAVCKQAVDKDRQIVGHSFHRCCLQLEPVAEMTITGAQIAAAVAQRAGSHAQRLSHSVLYLAASSSDHFASGDVFGRRQPQP